MSQFDAFGGGVNADFYRRSVEHEKQASRRQGSKASDQIINRRRRGDHGTADHTGQISLLSDPGDDHRLVSDAERTRLPYEQFRDAVLDAFYHAGQTHSAEQYLMYSSPRGVSYDRVDGGYVARVEVDGYLFEAKGESRYVALASLSGKVSGGPSKAVRKIEQEAIDLTGEGDNLARAAQYFRARQRKLSAYKGHAPEAVLQINDKDRTHAGYLGAEITDGMDIRALLGDRAIRSAVLLIADEAFDFSQPAEAFQKSDGRTEFEERRRTDRYSGPKR